MLARRDAEQAKRMRAMREFVIQQCDDVLLIAAADAFGFGAKRLVKLHEAFVDTFLEYADMVQYDSKDDKETVYSKEKVDERLHKLLGDEFSPWEERYGPGVLDKSRKKNRRKK